MTWRGLSHIWTTRSQFLIVNDHSRSGAAHGRITDRAPDGTGGAVDGMGKLGVASNGTRRRATTGKLGSSTLSLGEAGSDGAGLDCRETSSIRLAVCW